MTATEGFMKAQIEQLKEENKDLNKQIEQFKKGVKAGTNIIERLEEENQKLKSDLEKFSEAYKKYRDYEKEELAESCYDLAREKEKMIEEIKILKQSIMQDEWDTIPQIEEENKKLKEEKQELEYLGDINEELKEENKKLNENNLELKSKIVFKIGFESILCK